MTRKNYKSLVKILARNNINFDDHAELIGSIMSWFKEDKQISVNIPLKMH